MHHEGRGERTSGGEASNERARKQWAVQRRPTSMSSITNFVTARPVLMCCLPYPKSTSTPDARMAMRERSASRGMARCSRSNAMSWCSESAVSAAPTCNAKTFHQGHLTWHLQTCVLPTSLPSVQTDRSNSVLLPATRGKGYTSGGHQSPQTRPLTKRASSPRLAQISMIGGAGSPWMGSAASGSLAWAPALSVPSASQSPRSDRSALGLPAVKVYIRCCDRCSALHQSSACVRAPPHIIGDQTRGSHHMLSL